MSDPVTVSVPHKLGREEALRRLKTGLERANGQFGALISIDRQDWSGDTLQFQMRALGQSAAGTITVFEDNLRIEVKLPWLLAMAAEKILPTMRKQATLLLEKK
jgi:hypothetical protein